MKQLIAFLSAGAILGLAVAACGPSDGGSYSSAGYGPTYGPYGCGGYTSCLTCTAANGCGWCSYPDGSGSCASSSSECSYEWMWEENTCPANDAGATRPVDAGSYTLDAAVDAIVTVADAASDGAPAVEESSTGDANADAQAATPGDGSASDASNVDASSVSDAGSVGDGAPDAVSPSDASSDADAAPIDGGAADGGTGACTPNDGSLCGTDQPFGETCVRGPGSTTVPEPSSSLDCSVANVSTPVGTLFYCCTRAPSAAP